MLPLRDMFKDQSRFLCGIELVSTRGTMDDSRAVRTREFASELVKLEQCDWISITDNAGGNPMLSPTVLGKPILYGGKEVLIHLSCKDFNRNGLESTSWQLASEGFHNILTLSGDYPISGYKGTAKPVFDIDSIGLLKLLGDMNKGMSAGSKRALRPTQFFLGAVTTNFKLHENEVVPQYLKLAKKIELGAEFVIAQIGYDSRKSSELKAYMDLHQLNAPLIGNIFILNDRVAHFFSSGKIPGVVVTKELVELCQRQAKSPDHGKKFFLELAAKQLAIFRGLQYRGVYFGGTEEVEDLAQVFEMADSFSKDDWLQFAREIRFSRPQEFHYFEADEKTGLADATRKNPALLQTKPAPLSFHVNRWIHDRIFTPGTGCFNLVQKLYTSATIKEQGPSLLRGIEHASKSVMFSCKDCGDCSLPDIAFLCPESQCAKNQRNGPCGGTREGKCEVEDFECIWSQAYDRLKTTGQEVSLLQHAPVIQDQSLRGTSSWANTFLGRDHHGPTAVPSQTSQSHTAPSLTPPVHTPART